MIKFKPGFFKEKIVSLESIFALAVVLVTGLLAINPAIRLFDIKSPASATVSAAIIQEDGAANRLSQQKKCLVDLFCAYRIPFDSHDKWQLAEIILGESRKNRIDPILISALIFTESKFFSAARSVKDARGLMQLLHPTAQAIAQEIGFQDYNRQTLLHDPYLNLRLGIYYLAQLVRRFNSVELALVAYNIGPSRLDEIIASEEDIPTGFSKKVMRYYQQAQKKSRSYFWNN